MDYIKKILRDESGMAEGVSSALMIGMASGLSGIWSRGLSGIWDSLINNNSALILVFLTLVLIWLVVFKA